MPDLDVKAESRRRFLKFMSGSPLLAWPGLAALAAEDPIRWAPMRAEDLIASPKDALNVFDFEPVARKNIPPAHFGYMASGIDDEVTLRANREGFLKFQLRPALQHRCAARDRGSGARPHSGPGRQRLSPRHRHR